MAGSLVGEDGAEAAWLIVQHSIGNPPFMRNWDHTKEVIRFAYEFSEKRWPFDIQDPAAIIKSKKPLRWYRPEPGKGAARSPRPN